MNQYSSLLASRIFSNRPRLLKDSYLPNCPSRIIILKTLFSSPFNTNFISSIVSNFSVSILYISLVNLGFLLKNLILYSLVIISDSKYIHNFITNKQKLNISY